MRQILKTPGIVAVLPAILCLSGCALFKSAPSASEQPSGQTAETSETRLRVGDQLQVRLDTSGGQPNAPVSQPVDLTIDENGEISLPLIGRIKAEGQSTSELAERIEANYVPRYYVRCNANVLVTVRFFYVGGEVRGPGRFAWSEDVTLLKAINTAGGFTDYANRGKVEVIRGKGKKVYNCEELRRNPEKDPPIQPGDSIGVPRSIF